MKIEENASLAPYNTFGIHATARRMVTLGPCDDATDVSADAMVIGGGSNIVFTKDYDGTIVRLSDDEAVVVDGDGTLAAWAGMKLDRLVEFAIGQGLYGLENLSAIPGTVGGAVVQNAGAYGAETADHLTAVEVVDRTDGKLRLLTREDCHFGYRTSLFKQMAGRYMVRRALFRLSDTFTPNVGYAALSGMPHGTAAELRQSIVGLRWQKLPRPEESGSAGSFFKNPVVDKTLAESLKAEYPDMPLYPGNKLSAGWLIDKAGWKGRTMGRAGVWPHQALVLYNAGGCTGAEVVALAEAIRLDVQRKFGVSLVPEAIIV